MKIIKPSVVIESQLNEKTVLSDLERFGRTAYKSEEKITETSAKGFVKKLIASGHESVLEHINVTVRFICDRGVSHELVRHRIAAYTQESTRYMNYAKHGMEVISPCFWQKGTAEWTVWENAMIGAEEMYNHLLLLKASPQQARGVLPNSLKTEIVATMNLRQWRHVIKQRTAPGVHPQMQEIMNLLSLSLHEKLPTIFEDI